MYSETENKKFDVNCDSQVAILALDSTKIKFKTTLDVVMALNKLGENKQLLIICIPTNRGLRGNEHSDTLAERGANHP